MTDAHARLIYGIVTTGTMLYHRNTESVWAAVLGSPQQDDVSFDDARAAAFQLIAEHDPIKITVAMVLQKARGIMKARAPSTVEQWDNDAKLLLEGPQDTVDPTATSPAARGARWRRRRGIPAPKGNPAARAELAAWLGSLGGKMKLRCRRCLGDFAQIDVDGYVIRCMDAGREGHEEPKRLCLHCLGIERGDADVPF